MLVLVVTVFASCDTGDPAPTGTPRPGPSTAPPTESIGGDVARDEAVEAFRAWVAALAEGTIDRAWELMAASSRRALGSRSTFEDMRSGLAEGWGSWVAVRNAEYALESDDAGRTLLVAEGDIRPEGHPEHREVGIPIVRSDDGAVLLSPFEEFGNVARGLEEEVEDATDPPVPPGSGDGRRIVYANAAQRVWIVEADGSTRDTYLVSGKRGVPAPATYEVFSKSEVAFAGHDDITMRHMVRFARGENLPIGFHAIPNDGNGRPLQSEEELGDFYSAGCVRQSPGHAAALYEWADVGTTVVVLA